MDERVLSALARVFVPSGLAGERALGDVVRADTPLSALGPIDEAWPLVVAALDDCGVTLDLEGPFDALTVGDLDRMVRA